jgi:hypothetical protein
MALQVRPTRSEPGPNTGLRGRVGDEANVGAFHQGLEPSGSVSTAGYMCAILTVLASMEESRLATGRSPYMFDRTSNFFFSRDKTWRQAHISYENHHYRQTVCRKTSDPEDSVLL